MPESIQVNANPSFVKTDGLFDTKLKIGRTRAFREHIFFRGNLTSVSSVVKANIVVCGDEKVQA